MQGKEGRVERRVCGVGGEAGSGGVGGEGGTGGAGGSPTTTTTRATSAPATLPALVTSAVTVRPVVLRLAYLKVVYDKPWP